MSTIDGVPAHVLLNHFAVVLGPLSAILAISCALWPAARQRLIWPALTLNVVALIVTSLTASAGAWLGARVGKSRAVLVHEELGTTLTYFVATLLCSVTLLAVVHVRKSRGLPVKSTANAVVAILVVVAAAATTIQTYRVGESGARAAWGSLTAPPR